MRTAAGCVIIISALSATPSAAQPAAKAPRPEVFQKLIGCRALSDGPERLRCFDREAAALDVAEARSDVVVVDRQQLRTTRRSLFGLALPKIPFLDDEDGGPIKDFETSVQSASATRDGKWVLRLDNAMWRTTEASSYISDPRVGDPVRIKRGPLGSYSMSIKGQRAVKAMRLR